VPPLQSTHGRRKRLAGMASAFEIRRIGGNCCNGREAAVTWAAGDRKRKWTFDGQSQSA
jgi:hypothetical protein